MDLSNLQGPVATNPGLDNGPGVVVQSSPGVADNSKSFQNLEREVTSDSQYPLPTEEESKTLRKVAGSLPLVSFALCLVEFAERASYYGAKTVFSNFIQFELPEGPYNLSTLWVGTLLTRLKMAMEQALPREALRKRLAPWGWASKRHPD